MTVSAEAERQTNEPSGWFSPNVRAAPDRVTVSSALCELLAAVGIKQAFGIVGGGNAPFAEALMKSDIRLIHTRNEGGASFAATEASLATNTPTAVFTTTGPGLMNALTGIVGARFDGAKVLLISGTTSPALAGRGVVQETSSYTMPSDGLFRAGAVFNLAVEPTDAAQLAGIARRLMLGFQAPGAFVAHLALPLSLQSETIARPAPLAFARAFPSEASTDALTAVAERLRGKHFVIWVGYGARHAAKDILKLAEKTGAAVMCTPRAKGVFPENHPQYIGLTGAAGHDSVARYAKDHPIEECVVLGTRLGEGSSYWVERLVPKRGFIQVDVDASAIGTSYCSEGVLGVQSEVGGFLRRLTPLLLAAEPPQTLKMLDPEPTLTPRTAGPVRPQLIMQVIQKRIVDETDALVLSEAGASFGWANHHLRFTEAGRYRTSMLYASMGQVTAGVVGAALASGKKAVAIVGDGAMLMDNEISTAVAYEANVLWVVLNDSRYGITQQGMEAWGFTPVETEIPHTNFVKFAESMGAKGVRVESEGALDQAMQQALSHKGPFVIEIIVDRNEVSPILQARIARLRAEGNKNGI